MTEHTPGAGPNRLDRVMARRRPLLACYFALGNPLFDDAIRDIYHEAGVDIIELGIPTPDPYLDGPDVAGAMRRAIDAGADAYARMDDLLAWLDADEARPAGVCMAYNDLDITRIAQSARDRLAGFLIVDGDQHPDCAEIARIEADCAIRACGLVPLGFDPARLAGTAVLDGYVMMQSASGVTGPRDELDPRLAPSIAALKAGGVRQPILAGFGIGDARLTRVAMECGADGVVIGSMCVRKVVEGPAAIREFLQEIRAALDA